MGRGWATARKAREILPISSPLTSKGSTITHAPSCCREIVQVALHIGKHQLVDAALGLPQFVGGGGIQVLSQLADMQFHRQQAADAYDEQQGQGGEVAYALPTQVAQDSSARP
jgi:hypothetical protein